MNKLIELLEVSVEEVLQDTKNLEKIIKEITNEIDKLIENLEKELDNL